MRVFMAILCSLLAVCSVSARNRRHEGTDGQAAIYRLPPLRGRCDARSILRAGIRKTSPVCRIWTSVAAGGKVFGTHHDEAAGGRASAKRPAEVLRDVPAVREGFASACHARLQCRSVPSLGSGKIPKSTLIRKLEAGDRNIYREYIAFCNYKGKRHAMLLKRRKAEFALLYVP